MGPPFGGKSQGSKGPPVFSKSRSQAPAWAIIAARVVKALGKTLSPLMVPGGKTGDGYPGPNPLRSLGYATTLLPLETLRPAQPGPLHLVRRWIAPSAFIVSLSQAMSHVARP